MIFALMLRSLRRGKARVVSATLGMALATGALIFTASLVATNRAQAPRRAVRAAVPFAAWRTDAQDARASLALDAVSLTLDYRLDGRVMQGPPMRVLFARAPSENIYGAVRLAEGRWVDPAARAREVVCVRAALKRFGRLQEPPLGSELTFVGARGTMTARIVGYLDGEKLPREFPNVFANEAAARALASESFKSVLFYRTMPDGAVDGLLTPQSPSVIRFFQGDEEKRMDYATPLLLVASFLTALALLVNALFLSVESSRRTLAILRVVGMTRFCLVRLVAAEAIFLGFVGWVLGALGAVLALFLYVAAFPADFPLGVALDVGRMALSFAILPVLILLAILFALFPVLRVRPLDAASPRRARARRWGLVVTFACAFAAFVAVEVWGASLMRAFVPSPEWPDAIVSLLPAGVSSFDVEKVRTVEGVRQISELVPRQLGFEGLPPNRNALFLASEFLPRFRFLEGTWEEANEAVFSGDAVVITEMMARAHGLHKGDFLSVVSRTRRGSETLSFPIAGVVDLNWHMVTSRGLVRGLGGARGMTDGPVFCSLDTMGIIDLRTYLVESSASAPMTHLFVEYEKAFLAEHGVFEAGRRVEAEIARHLGNPTGVTVRLHARDEIADGTLAHGDDLIGQVARIPFIFLFILSLGFVSMLVAEADATREELVLLRTVGATRAQLVFRLARTAAQTTLGGVLLGTPLGALVGWLFAIKTGSLWPGLPHYFVMPIPLILEGAAFAFLFALVFALPTAFGLIRQLTRRRT